MNKQEMIAILANYKALPEGPEKVKERSRIAQLNAGIAHLLAVKFARVKPISDDIKHAAFLGVIHAIDRFDPKMDISFPSYAKWWVRHYVQEQERLEVEWTRGRNYKMPTEAREKAKKIRALEGREPTAEELGVSPQEYERFYSPDLYFVSTDEAQNSEGHPLDLEQRPSGYAEERERIFSLLDDLVNKLSPREKRIVHTVLVEEKTLEQASEELGVSVWSLRKTLFHVLPWLRKSLQEVA